MVILFTRNEYYLHDTLSSSCTSRVCGGFYRAGGNDEKTARKRMMIIIVIFGRSTAGGAIPPPLPSGDFRRNPNSNCGAHLLTY